MTVVSDRRDQIASVAGSRALRFLPLTALVLDGALLAVTTFAAIQGRERLPVFSHPAEVSESLDVVGPLIVLGWLLLIGIRGGYKENAFGAGTDEYKRVLNASLWAAGMVGVGCYLAKFTLARGFFALEFVIGIPLLILGRYLLRRLLHQARKRGLLRYRVVIAGSSAHIDEIARVLSRETWLGYQVVGALTPPTDLNEETAGGVPVLGNADEATDIMTRANADVIFFAGGALKSGKQLRHIVWDLERQDVQVVVAPSVTDVSSERVRIRPVGGLPLMHLDPPRATDAVRWAKRIFDVLGSTLLLVVCAPLLLVAAIMVKAYDGGPVIFRQTRIARDGDEFECLKLRTMVVDAERRLAELHREEDHREGLFKMENDPRVTRPGRWLRRFSVDELPQLVNVLRGEMSLVGPRPPLPEEVARYDWYATRRLQVRPGMTGLWQISGRSDLSWDDTVRLDLYYVDNWSMIQDLTILFRTLSAVIAPRGAY